METTITVALNKETLNNTLAILNLRMTSLAKQLVKAPYLYTQISGQLDLTSKLITQYSEYLTDLNVTIDMGSLGK
jgi:ribonucleotide reductase beta subunit family protein with ferritin-like domain